MDCSFLEFTRTGPSSVFDSANTHDAGASCTTCVGTVLTLGTSNNYLLIQGGASAAQLTAIDTATSGYTGVFNANGSGIAYKINVSTAGLTPNWTNNSSSQVTDGGLAIYETTASGGFPWYKLPTAGPSWAISIAIGFVLAGGYLLRGQRHELSLVHAFHSDRCLVRNLSAPQVVRLHSQSIDEPKEPIEKQANS